MKGFAAQFFKSPPRVLHAWYSGNPTLKGIITNTVKRKGICNARFKSTALYFLYGQAIIQQHVFNKKYKMEGKAPSHSKNPRGEFPPLAVVLIFDGDKIPHQDWTNFPNPISR